MPLLIAFVLLAIVLAGAVVLGMVGLVRRPFRTPAWQPVMGGVLLVRAAMLGLALGVAVLIAAWRHPLALHPLGLGVAGGALLGLGSALAADLQQGRWLTLHRPHRVFAVLVALALLARTLMAVVDAAAGRHDPTAWPMLAGLLGGYALAHAIALRERARRFARVQSR